MARIASVRLQSPGAMTAPHVLAHWGSDLTEADYQALAVRWIIRELADQFGIRRVDSITGGAMFGRKRGNLAGLIIPNIAPWDSHPRSCLARFLPLNEVRFAVLQASVDSPLRMRSESAAAPGELAATGGRGLFL